MKILIINSPVYIKKNGRNNEDFLPPIGLGLIYSNLENKYDLYFIDSFSENYGINDLLESLKLIEPNYSCINIFTTNYSIVKKIVERTKIKTHWIIGGISTKSLYKEIFDWNTKNSIDIIYGDGELIVESIIDGTITEEPKDKRLNRRFFIVDSKSKYFFSDISKDKLNRSIFRNEPQLNIFNELEICIYVSRGCPFNCAYCVAAYSRNREIGKIRRKNKDSIINELRMIEKKYPGVYAIRILDDLFLSNKEDFLEAVAIFNSFRFSWRAMCHIKSIKNIEDNLLIELAKSGCKELFIGIESGSKKILSKIHKTDDVDLIVNTVKRVIDAKISVKGYFICGFPDETEEDFILTLNLATELTQYSKFQIAKFRNSTFQFRPYFGTELYDEIINSKNLPKNYILKETKCSKKLNKKVRNKSFNFDSGNYSLISDELLLKYIAKMNKLNE